MDQFGLMTLIYSLIIRGGITSNKLISDEIFSFIYFIGVLQRTQKYFTLKTATSVGIEGNQPGMPKGSLQQEIRIV